MRGEVNARAGAGSRPVPPEFRWLCGRGHDASSGTGRKIVPIYELGFSEARFGHGPALQGPCARTPPFVPRLRLRPPTPWPASSWPLRPRMLLSGFRLSGFATLRSSGGTGELSMIQMDGGLCRLRLAPMPAPAASNGDRASPSRSRRTYQSRKALPHGHSVADCPLLRPSRRLPQPGLHDGIGRRARVDLPYSFKYVSPKAADRCTC